MGWITKKVNWYYFRCVMEAILMFMGKNWARARLCPLLFHPRLLNSNNPPFLARVYHLVATIDSATNNLNLKISRRLRDKKQTQPKFL